MHTGTVVVDHDLTLVVKIVTEGFIIFRKHLQMLLVMLSGFCRVQNA